MGLEGVGLRTRWMGNDCARMYVRMYVWYNRHRRYSTGMTMHSPLHLPLNVILKPRLVPLIHATYHVTQTRATRRRLYVCMHVCDIISLSFARVYKLRWMLYRGSSAIDTSSFSNNRVRKKKSQHFKPSKVRRILMIKTDNYWIFCDHW